MKRFIPFLIVIGLWAVTVLPESLYTSRLSVTTTKADTTFTGDDRWETVSIWFDSCSAYIQVGSPGDTASISTRDSILVPEKTVISFGPGAKLRRIRYWATSGTGMLYMIGTKTKVH